MIVDLLRNDLGRVARRRQRAGGRTLRPRALPDRLADDLGGQRAGAGPTSGSLDLFRALFPCGSVTGAPKRRTMQLIARPRADAAGRLLRRRRPGRSPGRPVPGPVQRRHPDRRRRPRHRRGRVRGGRRHHLGLRGGARNARSCTPRRPSWRTTSPSTGCWRRWRSSRARVCATSTAISPGWPTRPTGPVSVSTGAAVLAPWPGPSPAAPTRRGSGSCCPGTGTSRSSCRPLPPTGGRPVRLALDDDPVDAASPWLQHKTTRRDVYLTRALRHPEADDVVLVNERGELTETTTANLALRIGGRWWTPPTTSGCLPGVERGRLLELGRLQERVLSVDGPATTRSRSRCSARSGAGGRHGCSPSSGPPGRRRTLPVGSSPERLDERTRTRPRRPVDRRLPGPAGRPHGRTGSGRHRRGRGRPVGRRSSRWSDGSPPTRSTRDIVREIVAAADAQRDACLAGRRRRRGGVLGRRRGDEDAARHRRRRRRPGVAGCRRPSWRRPGRRSPSSSRPSSSSSWRHGCCRSPTAT